MSEPSKTPRTDAAKYAERYNNGTWTGGTRMVVQVSVAEELELALAAAETALAQSRALSERQRVEGEGYRAAILWWALRCGKLQKEVRAIAASDKRVRELEAALDALRDDHVDKVMAISDEQISALCRSEGRNPDDVAKMTQQLCEIAMLRVALQRLADAADDVGVTHLDKEDLTDEGQAMLDATARARALLAPPATKEPQP